MRYNWGGVTGAMGALNTMFKLSKCFFDIHRGLEHFRISSRYVDFVGFDQ